MSITHSTEIINGEAVTILIETADSLDSTTQSTERTRATTRGVASDRDCESIKQHNPPKSYAPKNERRTARKPQK